MCISEHQVMSNNLFPITSSARIATARYGPKQLGLFATMDIRPHQDITIGEPMLSVRAADSQAAIERSHGRFFKSVSALSKKDL